MVDWLGTARATRCVNNDDSVVRLVSVRSCIRCGNRSFLEEFAPQRDLEQADIRHCLTDGVEVRLSSLTV